MNKKKLAAILIVLVVLYNYRSKIDGGMSSASAVEITLSSHAWGGAMAMATHPDSIDNSDNSDDENKLDCGGTGRIGDGGPSSVECPGCDNPKCPIGKSENYTEQSPEQVETEQVETEDASESEIPDLPIENTFGKIKTPQPTNPETVQAEPIYSSPAEKFIAEGRKVRIILLTNTNYCQPCRESKDLIINKKLSTPSYKKAGWTYGPESSNILQVIDTSDNANLPIQDMMIKYIYEHPIYSNGKIAKSYGGTIPCWIRVQDGKIHSWVSDRIDFNQFNNFLRNGLDSSGRIVDNDGKPVSFTGDR